MPDLTFAAAADWVRANETTISSLADQPPREVEQREDVGKALLRLGMALDAYDPGRAVSLLEALQPEPVLADLRQIMGQLGPVRIGRLIGWLVKDGPAGADTLLGPLVDGGDVAASYIHACLVEPVRPTLLLRLYEPSRLAALLEVCRGPDLAQEAA